MKLVPTRPVTILSVRHGERWFPFLFRHTDGSLLMYIGHGHDRHFAPHHRLRSLDGGRTWLEEQENVPRPAWCHSFADGELFEIDAYGFQDPKATDTFVYYGAWSFPSDPQRKPVRDTVRVHNPSSGSTPLHKLLQAYPSHPWWPLYNKVHGKAELRGDEVLVGGPNFGSGIEHDGRLLAAGYIRHKDDVATGVYSAYCYASDDRGRNWEEWGLVGRGTKDTGEGFNEATMVALKNGQLYQVLRSGRSLYHGWSSDGGKTWTRPELLRLSDSDYQPRMAWPVCKVLEDGTLVLVFGRPGKHMVFDPSGTGKQWQGRLDLHAWELETQALMGVPEELRLHGPTEQGVRYWDSADYLACVPVGPREMLVCYDVQGYYENWNSLPASGVRMLRVRLE